MIPFPRWYHLCNQVAKVLILISFTFLIIYVFNRAEAALQALIVSSIAGLLATVPPWIYIELRVRTDRIRADRARSLFTEEIERVLDAHQPDDTGHCRVDLEKWPCKAYTQSVVVQNFTERMFEAAEREPWWRRRRG